MPKLMLALRCVLMFAYSDSALVERLFAALDARAIGHVSVAEFALLASSCVNDLEALCGKEAPFTHPLPHVRCLLALRQRTYHCNM